MKHGREATALFEQRGRTVIRIWECELKRKNRQALTESRIVCPKRKYCNIADVQVYGCGLKRKYQSFNTFDENK